MASHRHHKHRRASPSSDDDQKSSKRHKHHRSNRRDVENEIVVHAKVEDDVEEGEICEDEENLGDGKSGLNIGDGDGLKSDNNVEKKSGGHNVRGSLVNDFNGVSNIHVEDRRGNGEYDSLSRGNRKGKTSYRDEVEKNELDGIEGERESLSNNSMDHKSEFKPRSPSRDRYYDEIRHRSRSRSYDRLRERSRSRSILDEEHHLERRRYQERDNSYHQNKGRRVFDSDEEKMTCRHGSIDRRDSERERSVSRSRYMGEDDTRHRRESRDNYKSRKIDGYYERRREKERARSRGLDIDRDQRACEWDKRMDRGLDRERSRERDIERDWRRERERGMDRDRVNERERDVYRERQRERDLDIGRGRGLRRDRDIERDRDIYRSRDIENDRDKYDDKYSNSGRSRHEERARTDRKKDHSFKSDSLGEDMLNSHDNDDDGFEDRVSFQLAEQEDEDLNIIEESRRRRQAILEEHKNRSSQQKTELSPIVEKCVEQGNQSVATSSIITATPDERNGAAPDTEVDFADAAFSVGKSPQQNGIPTPERTSGVGGLGEGTPKGERSGDMICDDIFGESPAGVRKLAKEDDLLIERSGLYDNWDDADGYYAYRFGEIMDGRYEIAAAHGKGVFSTVVRAKDRKAGVADPDEVAIKIIRNNETMYKAGMEELVILKKLVGADPEDKRHCVRFLSSFKYRNHLCLVFESLNMNLREVLKKFGRNIGLKLTAVRAYAKQLFIALKHLRNCGVLHSDIKPDNMLVNEAKNVLKLCDFGSAMFSGKNEITPYLVSRFYRAPEIILGLPYDHPLDMWSVGCCLYELYTGKVLFPGSTNNAMLRLHMELKGPFPKKMVRKAAFAEQHFDLDLNFHAVEEDPVTKKIVKRVIVNVRPKEFGSLVKGSTGEDPKMLAKFKDLLDKIFILDPEKRLTVSQALSHPFITGK